ncbi:MAG TPA: hypothetical protein VGO47_00770 [Chlamydiales bacterium]|nr:hypothetical protein [Chlamydiales bacterium]
MWIVHPNFLTALFHYRYVTNAAATTQIEEESYGGLMSCVDILLDSLCDAILSFSSNSFEENNLQNPQELAFCIFTSSRIHKEKVLSVIARLPGASQFAFVFKSQLISYSDVE